MITEIVVLGRGGQGGVTGAQIIAEAAYLSKNYKDVTSSPTFGTERRGSAVFAFTRIADEKIWTRQNIYNPNIAIILDETILTSNFINSIKPNGILIINTDKCANEMIKKYDIPDDITVAVSNVTHYCYQQNLIVDGQPMVSTPILGILPKVLKTISMESLKSAIIDRIGDKKADLNMKVAEMSAQNADLRLGKSRGR